MFVARFRRVFVPFLVILFVLNGSQAIDLRDPKAWFDFDQAEKSGRGECLRMVTLRGKIYVVNFNRFELYNVHNNTRTDMVRYTNSRWCSAVGVWEKENRICVVGGYPGHGPGGATMECFNPDADEGKGEWTDAKNTMPEVRSYSGYAMLNEELYVIGGLTSTWEQGGLETNSVMKTTLHDNKWTAVADFPHTAIGISAVSAHGSIWAAGGSNLNTLYRYTSHGDSWQTMASMRYKRSSLGLVVASNMLIAVGGRGREAVRQNDPIADLKAVEAYDFEKDQWKDMPPLKTARRSFGIVAFRNYS